MATSGDWREPVSYDSEDKGDDGIDKGIDNIVFGVDDVKRRTQSTFYAHLLSQSISVSQAALRRETGTKPVTQVINELKLKIRAEFLNLVGAALTKEGSQCSHEDVLKFAIKAEYDIFNNTKGITTYRWKIIELFESIMGETEKSLDPVIQDLKLLNLKPRTDRGEDEHEDRVDEGCIVSRESRHSEKTAASEYGDEKVDLLCQAIQTNGQQCCKEIVDFSLNSCNRESHKWQLYPNQLTYDHPLQLEKLNDLQNMNFDIIKKTIERHKEKKQQVRPGTIYVYNLENGDIKIGRTARTPAKRWEEQKQYVGKHNIKTWFCRDHIHAETLILNFLNFALKYGEREVFDEGKVERVDEVEFVIREIIREIHSKMNEKDKENKSQNNNEDNSLKTSVPISIHYMSR